MIENIHRPMHNLRIPLRITIRKQMEEHFLLAVHIHMLIHNNDELGKRHLPRPPDRMHHPTRLQWILFANLHKRAIMKNSRYRQRIIHNIRHDHLQQRQENPLRRLPQKIILHRRLAHDRRRINRIFAVRNRRHVIRRIPVGQRIKPGVITKRPLHQCL